MFDTYIRVVFSELHYTDRHVDEYYKTNGALDNRSTNICVTCNNVCDLGITLHIGEATPGNLYHT